MKEITVWDILLLLEFIVYFVFMLLVALEFCSTSFSVDTSLGSEVRKTIYLFVFIGSLFRMVSIIMHVFLVLPDYCREFVTVMLEESTNLVFITGLSLQVVFLVQIYYALLGLAQPAIRHVFITVIMTVYVCVLVLVFLCLFMNARIMLDCIHIIISVMCIFCLTSLLIYGNQIYREMKRLEVSRTIIMKMVIIMLISSFTFFLRAILECLFVFDIIVLDFDDSTNGSMHVIGSHLYASTMYFFFYYFLTEINPLSILLISTYIRPRPVSKPVHTPKSPSSYSTVSLPSMERQHSSIKDIFHRGSKSRSEDAYQSLLSNSDNSQSMDIQLSSHFSSKKRV